MSADRDKILSRIQSIRQDEKPLPQIPEFRFGGTLLERFTTALEANHVQVLRSAGRESTLKLIREQFTSSGKSIDLYTKPETPLPDDPHELSDIQVFITTSPLGVAENGAMWLGQEQYRIRILPFIVDETVMVVRSSSLVSNMHEAYKNASPADGFGLFVSGPSKTADIEQSLVIGAHGPKRMTVILEE